LIFLVFVLMFSSFIVAQSNSVSSAVEGVFDPIKSTFGDWQNGTLSINIAKYIFWFLITVIIFAIVRIIPGIKETNKGLQFILSLAVAFLATAYLTPSNLYLMLTSYGALGIVFGTGIPFVIMLYFSIAMSKDGGIGGQLLSKIMWSAFTLFLVWKAIDGAFALTYEGPALINTTEGVVYLIFIGFCIFWLFGLDRFIMKKLVKAEDQDALSEYSRISALSAGRIRTDSEAVKKSKK
jgi:hypothetical protein